MKIKQLLGMLVLDTNANEVGKIVDAEFDPAEGTITQISIDLKKNFISSNKIDVDYADIKSIGDYVLLNIEINKEAAIEAAEKAKKEAKEAEKAAKEAAKEAEKEAEEEKEVVEAEIVEDAEDEESTDVEIE